MRAANLQKLLVLVLPFILLYTTATFVLELHIHPFCEQLVINCHSVFVLSISQIYLTGPLLVKSLSCVVSATIMYIENIYYNNIENMYYLSALADNIVFLKLFLEARCV